MNKADIEAGGRNADYVFARRFDNTQCRRDNEDDFIALTRGLWLNNPIGGEKKIKKRMEWKVTRVTCKHKSVRCLEPVVTLHP